MSVWNNITHIVGSFTQNPGMVESNIGDIPAWQKMTGHLAGTTPYVPNIPASRPRADAHAFMKQFPNIFKLNHG